MQYGDGTQANLGDILTTKRVESTTPGGAVVYTQVTGTLVDEGVISPYDVTTEIAGFGKVTTHHGDRQDVDLSSCTKVA